MAARSALRTSAPRTSALAIAAGLLLAAWGLAACGEDEALPLVVAPPPEPETVLRGEERPSLYGEDGELLESDTVVAGLRLPRGLDPMLEDGRRHVYTSAQPLTKVQSYFGVRLVTGQVDQVGGGGIVYHDAVPRDVRGGEVRLDVTIEASSASETRVEIVEAEPPIVTPPPEAETIRRAQELIEQGR